MPKSSSGIVIAGAQRRTVAEAGEAYIEHLEFVMERKHTTVADYRGYLCRHLAPFFGDRPLDRIDAACVEVLPAVPSEGPESPRRPSATS